MIFKQTITLLLVSIVLGLAVNLFSPHKINYIGKYRSLSNSSDPIIPPEAQPGDPPFIAINIAQMEHDNSKTIFIDARDPEEYDCGTIPGAINIPFEYLPEDNLGAFVDSALGGVAKDHPLIVFCSGEECDLSLHLARNLQDLGYTNLSIFFGGAREWKKFGLKMEVRKPCGE